MPLPIYLAMTAAELQQNVTKSSNIAWMACHFSPYGTGLSNCPKSLPPGSMLILNDRTPVGGHDAALIAEQLQDLVQQLDCDRVLLDLQRPSVDETRSIINAILAALPCPVGVSECYGKELDCPVFLPPIPLLATPETYLKSWHGRDIWLEMALTKSSYRITERGCSTLPFTHSNELIHRDAKLHCRYSIDISEDAATFSLARSKEDLETMAQAMEEMGVSCRVGLYQELG